MALPLTNATQFRFGPYEAEVPKRELRKNGRRVPLRGKSFTALVALLESPGQVVTRDELRHRLWPEGTFVDFENSLNSTMNRLRDALGDPAADRRFIETLQRIGYRFIAPVQVAGTTVPTLAVLPFENLDQDPTFDSLAAGVSDSLITALGNTSLLRIVARQSVLHLRGTQCTVQQIARELKVDAIVEGSVLHAGNRLRVTARLVQADPEQYLWAKDFDYDLGDPLTLQSQGAQAIAASLQAVLLPAASAV